MASASMSTHGPGMHRPYPRALPLLAACLFAAPACGDDSAGDDEAADTGETTDTGGEASFEVRTVSGGTRDLIGENYVQCWGDPDSGYTKVLVQFDPQLTTMVQSQHEDPNCSDVPVDAASFEIEGGPAGDQTIVGWEPDRQPAHIEVPITATRIDGLRIGEDGQGVPNQTVLLVDDSVDPPRIYSGREEGPMDADGYPTTLYDDFLSDRDAPVWGTWVATAAGEVRDLNGTGEWTRCVFEQQNGINVYERWSFDNDRLSTARFDNGDDPSCAAGESGSSLSEGTWVVLIDNDMQGAEFLGGAPPEASFSGPVTASELRLWNASAGQIASRLLVIDEGAEPARFYISPDAEGFAPAPELEPTGFVAN